MMSIFATRAWHAGAWHDQVRLCVTDGIITQVHCGTQPQSEDARVDTLLPALANLHSHSFQRAMAGRTEHRRAGQDSFWSWRSLMYQFLDHLTPDQIEAIAGLVFMEMQEAGYAAVGEFHYVHHQPGGTPYDDPAELSKRILAAATQTGIGLTHLPVLYTYGGAGQAPLSGGQRRFGTTIDAYLHLLDQIACTLSDMPADTRLGVAPHSLRATAPQDLTVLLANSAGRSVHLHIAEQPKEVEDIQNWLAARPVEWLLETQSVTKQWCLIHATHMTEAETLNLAKTGAVVGLCPITEANLGDGPFSGPHYLGAGGTFGVGSDSNIRISLSEELFMLEYSQRLRDLKRNLMVPETGSVGQTLYLGAAAGGAQALQRNAGKLEVGCLADLVAINSADAQLAGLAQTQIFDGLCFAASDRVVTDLWSAGRHMVQSGRHILRDKITQDYGRVMAQLLRSLTD
jgi:formimidoylglutamate deiminase